jgi:hypothetical protein
MGGAMDCRIIIAGGLLLALCGAASAQRANDRIDLDAIATAPRIAGLPSVRPAAAHVAFAENEAACLERHGNLQISGGALRLHQLLIGKLPPPRSIKPIDDEGYQYEIATKDCRIQLDVRLQLRRDRSWTSLSLPWASRPSIPLAERNAATRRLLEQGRERAKSTPPAGDRPPSQPPVKTVLGDELGQVSEAFFFEDAPKTCFEAVGTYALGRDGATFSFMAGLPGDINRFAIERADVDSYRGRLYFVREDCRYEITIRKWIWYHFDWAPVRLVLMPPLR